MGDGKKELMRQVEERHKDIPTEPYDVYLHEDIHEETEYICTGTTNTCTRTCMKIYMKKPNIFVLVPLACVPVPT